MHSKFEKEYHDYVASIPWGMRKENNMDKRMEQLIMASGAMDIGYVEPVSILADVADGVELEIAPPMYKKGDIIDIRPSKNGAPNRIMIVSIVAKVTADGGRWVYNCEFESDHSIHPLDESYMANMIINKQLPVYDLPVVKERYNHGWRYHGKYARYGANEVSAKLVANPIFKSVRMCEAYDPNGKLMVDKVSLWIKYEKPFEGPTADNIDVILK